MSVDVELQLFRRSECDLQLTAVDRSNACVEPARNAQGSAEGVACSAVGGLHFRSAHEHAAQNYNMGVVARAGHRRVSQRSAKQLYASRAKGVEETCDKIPPVNRSTERDSHQPTTSNPKGALMYKSNRFLAAATIAVASLGVLAPRADANHQSAEVIIEWNQLLQQNIGGPPFSQVRTYAMMHVAMADAVVAIEGDYKPYRARVWAPRGASAEAAAAQAARDVLVVLIPAGQTTFDAALEARLANISPGRRASGVAVGKKVAAEILAWRQNDGFAAANPQPPAFLPSTLPGIWRPTATGPAQFSRLGDVEPFGLLTPTQFLPIPQPQLESAEYAEAFNEVKNKGRATASTRTPEETRFAQLFAGAPGPFFNATGAFRLWGNVARDVSQSRNYSLSRTARLYALLSASINDSLQTSQTSKFIYRLWRPETAIDQAGVDDNPATTAEAGWPPLLTTPPYPSHASNMACIGAGAARMLANVFGGDTQAFTATWYTGTTPPAVVHAQPYTSFSALARDEGLSRIWGGIHFRFEIDASEISCNQVADYIYDNYMQRRKH